MLTRDWSLRTGSISLTAPISGHTRTSVQLQAANPAITDTRAVFLQRLTTKVAPSAGPMVMHRLRADSKTRSSLRTLLSSREKQLLIPATS